MRRLLILFHDPYHLDPDEALAWLRKEVAGVLSRDDVARATLTRLGDPSSQTYGGFGWLLELGVTPGGNVHGPVRELIADLRLLGMSPVVAVADDSNAFELDAT